MGKHTICASNMGEECDCENREQHTIKIYVEGGVVQDVKGLPERYNYEIFDADDCSITPCERRDCPICSYDPECPANLND